ncbi:MAG: adenosylcobinamide kinase/adenosylcobinamide phosphate guanyltransferase [Micromonosporaceae bacterium]|nr:adenosylcobinamide kinase/adenosylcobinamide phosphate guanyltransferase [Micromonosporaceae bacterium]
MRTLVLGGTRSGKSAYAEKLVAPAASVSYVATARRRDGDPEWAARLAAHRQRRPAHWRTVEPGETPHDLPRAVRDAHDVLLVDDLGGWVAALWDAAGWEDSAAVEAAMAELAEALSTTNADVVLVSPEVGLSVVPDNPAARRFANAIGALNQAIAEVCDGVALVVAGRALWVKGGTANLT